VSGQRQSHYAKQMVISLKRCKSGYYRLLIGNCNPLPTSTTVDLELHISVILTLFRFSIYEKIIAYIYIYIYIVFVTVNRNSESQRLYKFQGHLLSFIVKIGKGETLVGSLER